MIKSASTSYCHIRTRKSHDKKPGTKRQNKRHEPLSMMFFVTERQPSEDPGIVKARTPLHLLPGVGAGADFREDDGGSVCFHQRT